MRHIEDLYQHLLYMMSHYNRDVIIRGVEVIDYVMILNEVIITLLINELD